MDLNRTDEAYSLISELDSRKHELAMVEYLKKQRYITISRRDNYEIKGDTKDKILSLIEEDLIKEIEEIENKLKEI